MLDGLKSSLGDAIKKIVKSSGIDEELIKDLCKDVQRALLTSDVNVRLVLEITKRLEERSLNETPPPGLSRKDHIVKILYDELSKLLGNESDFELKPGKQNKIILLGIQGSGKTTVASKLAKFLTGQGHKVGVVGADTYRPGALIQLKMMCEKSNVEVYGEENNKDSAEIVKNGLKHFENSNIDVVLIDTAGRLQNKKNLMEEYRKIANVTKKIDESAPHDVILVLDATSGQNVINQVEEFNKIIPITGVIMTKLDGTAKGGILLALAKKYKLPIIALGLGEKEDDLQLFNAEKFADAFIQVS